MFDLEKLVIYIRNEEERIIKMSSEADNIEPMMFALSVLIGIEYKIEELLDEAIREYGFDPNKVGEIINYLRKVSNNDIQGVNKISIL